MILDAADAATSAITTGTVATTRLAGTTGNNATTRTAGTTGNSTTVWTDAITDTTEGANGDAPISRAAISKYLTLYELIPCQKYCVLEELAVEWAFC